MINLKVFIFKFYNQTIKTNSKILFVLLNLIVIKKYRQLLRLRIKNYTDRLLLNNVDKLCIYYSNKLKINKVSFLKKIEPHPKIIWQLWIQGESNIPLIVKECMKSIDKYFPDYQRILLTKETIKDYIAVPDFIEEKYKSKKISTAHYSDIVRTLLLIEYGGIWIDATVLFTDFPPCYIINSNFFVFKNKETNNHSYNSSWFIVADKNNQLLISIKNILLEYWSNFDYIISYFLWHNIAYTLINNNKYFADLFNSIHYDDNLHRAGSFYHSIDCYESKKIDLINIQKILKSSFVHKTTYKKEFINIKIILSIINKINSRKELRYNNE